MHCVGIDAGGTKIRVAWRSADGQVAEYTLDAAADGGPAPLLAWKKNLPNAPRSVVAGITKFTRTGIADNWQKTLTDAFPGCRIQVLPDWRIAFEGALAGRDGVLVIAGTGSVAIGRRDGVLQRTGGRGWEYGDEGSGAHLTTEIIRRALRALDGMAPTTVLTNELARTIGQTEPAAFAETCRQRATVEGRGFLVPFLVQHALGNEPEAVDLFRGAAGWLARLCATNANRCGFPSDAPLPVHTVGGIFDCGPWARDPFPILLARRYPRSHIVDSVQKPVLGALALAEAALAD